MVAPVNQWERPKNGAKVGRSDRPRHLRAYFFVAGAFVVSRALYFAAGVRFQTENTFQVIHLIDAPVVRAEPLRSVFFDHAQPPLFNLLWALSLRIGGVVVMVIAIHPRDWRQLAAVGALPLLLVRFWYGRGAVLFNNFAVSSWLGGSLSQVSVHQLQRDELAKLVADGTLSPYAAFPLFLGLEEMKMPHTNRIDPKVRTNPS